MELELIEPSLYLRMDPLAADRFAKALQERMEELGGSSKKNEARGPGATSPQPPG